MDLVDAFVARQFPVPEPANPKPPTDFAERGKRFAGSYRFTRQNWSTI
jgi:hypothetical protein